MLELGLKVLIAYLLGSVMGSLLLGRLRGTDIRKLGSGNAGATNALRTQGKLFALGVMAIDVGKGALAAGAVPALALPFVPADPEVSREWLAFSCAAAAVVGHVFPVWHGFRGGKGAATLVGTIVVLAPALVLPVLAIWIGMIVLTGYVGLSTIIAAASVPLYLGLARLPEERALFIYACAMAAFVVFTHRSNIARMLAGTENHNPGVMLFRRLRRD